MDNRSLGMIGENVTCKYLEKCNYNIIERNFYYKGGEIDIIAFDKEKDEMVFIEVKTRSNRAYGLPSESVSKVKLNHIIRGAKYYLHINGIENINVRFDIIELFLVGSKFFINQIKQVV